MGETMSTALLFKIPEQPLEEVERQRDRLQLRNAELVLTLQEIQRWLHACPEFEMGGCAVHVVGWSDAQKLVDDRLEEMTGR